MKTKRIMRKNMNGCKKCQRKYFKRNRGKKRGKE